MRSNFTSKVQYTYFFDIICVFLYMPATSFLYLLFVNSSLPSSTWLFFSLDGPFSFPVLSQRLLQFSLQFTVFTFRAWLWGKEDDRFAVLPVSIFSCPLGHNVRHPVFKITSAPIWLFVFRVYLFRIIAYWQWMLDKLSSNFDAIIWK